MTAENFMQLLELLLILIGTTSGGAMILNSVASQYLAYSPLLQKVLAFANALSLNQVAKTEKSALQQKGLTNGNSL